MAEDKKKESVVREKPEEKPAPPPAETDPLPLSAPAFRRMPPPPPPLEWLLIR